MYLNVQINIYLCSVVCLYFKLPFILSRLLNGMSIKCLDVLVYCYSCTHILSFCFCSKVTLLNHSVCSGIILSAKPPHTG